MQFLPTNTAVIVAVGPFKDKTDGVTLETALTITNEKITLVAETVDGSAPTLILDNVTGATSGTSNDLNYITGQDNAMMQLELSAANLNRFGHLTLTITDAANHCPVEHEYFLVTADYYGAMVGSDRLQVDVREMANDVITDAVIAADAEVDIADAVWDALTADHVVANSFGTSIGAGASAATIADAVWDEATSGHVAGGSFGAGVKLAANAVNAAALATDTGLKPHRSGTAQAGAAGTITLDAGASAIDNFNLYQLVKIESGIGAGQSRAITGYVGATKVATVFPNWVTTPDNTSVFTVLASGVLAATTPPTATENADALLARDIGSGTGAGSTDERTVRAALRWNRNKITIVGTTMTVYKEDDTTVAWTGTVSGGLATALGMDAT